ncbi:hypothetical protein [Streptomyces sp. NPDC001985]
MSTHILRTRDRVPDTSTTDPPSLGNQTVVHVPDGADQPAARTAV